MALLSDDVTFTLLQMLLCVAFLEGLLLDLWRPRLKVKRADRTMMILYGAVGFAVPTITLINQTALKDDFWLQNYSVLINLADVGIILYLGLFSYTCRQRLLQMWINRLQD
jgi:hypothetical protein